MKELIQNAKGRLVVGTGLALALTPAAALAAPTEPVVNFTDAGDSILSQVTAAMPAILGVFGFLAAITVGFRVFKRATGAKA